MIQCSCSNRLYHQTCWGDSAICEYLCVYLYVYVLFACVLHDQILNSLMVTCKSLWDNLKNLHACYFLKWVFSTSTCWLKMSQCYSTKSKARHFRTCCITMYLLGEQKNEFYIGNIWNLCRVIGKCCGKCVSHWSTFFSLGPISVNSKLQTETKNLDAFVADWT